MRKFQKVVVNTMLLGFILTILSLPTAFMGFMKYQPADVLSAHDEAPLPITQQLQIKEVKSTTESTIQKTATQKTPETQKLPIK